VLINNFKYKNLKRVLIRKMKKILHIDSSPRISLDSISKQLSQKIVNILSEKYDVEVIYKDLHKEKIPFIDNDWVNVAYKKTPRTDKEKKVLECFEVQSFIDADFMVMGSPMYDFNIPSILKNYIEHLYISGITLDYKYKSLVNPKKIYIASSAGWNYKGKEVEKDFEGMFRKAFEFLRLKDIFF